MSGKARITRYFYFILTKLFMIKKISFPTVLTLATLEVGVLAQSAEAFTLFTDRSAWEAAIAGATITTDPFDNDIPQGQSITLDSGIISTNSPPAVAFNDNSVFGGVYVNATDGGGSLSSETITWDFPEPISAFAADFAFLEPGELSLTGNFDGTGDVTLTVFEEIGGQNGFLGIVGEANFGSIVFGNNSTTTAEIFNIDNASFATQSTSESVPEPSSIIAVAMLGSGLLLTKRGKKN